MASGLIQQLSLCGINLPKVDTYVTTMEPPSWCMNQNLIGSLLSGLDRLWQGIEGAGPENIYSEVWSYSYSAGMMSGPVEKEISKRQDGSAGGFSVADLGKLSPTGTEADGVQLWSYGFLALEDPRQVQFNSTGSSNPTNSTSSAILSSLPTTTPSSTGVSSTVSPSGSANISSTLSISSSSLATTNSLTIPYSFFALLLFSFSVFIV
jgi:hypothetical protein